MIQQFYLTYKNTLTGTINPYQSGPGSNGNEGLFVYAKVPETLSLIIKFSLDSCTGNLLGGVLPFCRGAIGVFYNPSRTSRKTSITQIRIYMDIRLFSGFCIIIFLVARYQGC